MEQEKVEDAFKIKDSDVDWMKGLMKALKVGGIWQTTFGTFKKTDENTLELIAINTEQTEYPVEKNIWRVGEVCKRAEIRFVNNL